MQKPTDLTYYQNSNLRKFEISSWYCYIFEPCCKHIRYFFFSVVTASGSNTELRKQLAEPKNMLTTLVQESAGSIYNLNRLEARKRSSVKKASTIISQSIAEENSSHAMECQVCDCLSTIDGQGWLMCHRCISPSNIYWFCNCIYWSYEINRLTFLNTPSYISSIFSKFLRTLAKLESIFFMRFLIWFKTSDKAAFTFMMIFKLAAKFRLVR